MARLLKASGATEAAELTLAVCLRACVCVRLAVSFHRRTPVLRERCVGSVRSAAAA